MKKAVNWISKFEKSGAAKLADRFSDELRELNRLQ